MSLKLAKPSNAFISWIFPCKGEYRDMFYDLFASSMERAIDYDYKKPKNWVEIDKALKAAIEMTTSGEVHEYLNYLFVNEFIGGEKYRFLSDRLNALPHSS